MCDKVKVVFTTARGVVMKGCKMVIFATFLGFSMLSGQVFAGTYLDDFADGVDDGWVPLIGDWKVEGGVYKQILGGDIWQRAMLETIEGKDYNVSDFEVSVTAQLPTGKSGWLGLVFLHDKIDPVKAAVPHYTYSLTYDGRNIVRIYKPPSGAVGKVDWIVDKPLSELNHHLSVFPLADASPESSSLCNL